VAVNMSASEVPSIDLRHPRAEVAAAIDQACREVGFFAIAGHGLPDDIADAAWAAGRDFFALPLDQRLAVAMPEPGYPYGYCALSAETLASSMGTSTPPDLKETYAIGPVDPPPTPLDAMTDADERAVFAPNLWPAALPALRPAWEAYYRVMAELAGRLMDLFAAALDLPDGWFETFIDRHGSAMRMIRYPHVDRDALPGQLRAGAHTDYGTLTILRQDDAPGGLEVLTVDGRWAPVPFAPGTFVVNIGDLMARWTNDRWRSTLHRVVLPPPDAQGSTERFSFPFFHNANWDASVECLPTCLASGDEPRYPPVRAGAHLMAKFRSTVL
jgi:isopenicillin N synthase-like dioxygenase